MNKSDLLIMLSRHNIKYDVYEHPSLHTVEESKKLRGKIKGIHTKNLFLKNKKNNFFCFLKKDFLYESPLFYLLIFLILQLYAVMDVHKHHI